MYHNTTTETELGLCHKSARRQPCSFLVSEEDQDRMLPMVINVQRAEIIHFKSRLDYT